MVYIFFSIMIRKEGKGRGEVVVGGDGQGEDVEGGKTGEQHKKMITR